MTLTHHNIASNLEQMRMVFRITPQDRFCGVLALERVDSMALQITPDGRS